MATLVMLIWLGSAASGWLGFFPWLAVPPVLFSLYAWNTQRRTVQHMKQNGMSGEFFKRQMLGPNIQLVVWNTIINAVIFGVAMLIAGIV